MPKKLELKFPVNVTLPLPVTKETASQRHVWIDVAKGIGIVLMLLGHLPIPTAFYKAIHSFNMPCFFLLAGLVFSSKHPFTTFFIQKLRLLIKPYFIFSIVSFGLWLYLRPYSNTMQHISPNNVLFSMLYGSNSAHHYMAHNMPLWFLPCVFVSFLLFYGLTKLPKFWHMLVAVLFVLSNYVLAHYLIQRLPWSIDVALVSVGFMSVGYLAKNFFFNTKLFTVPTLLVLCAINLSVCFMNSLVDMNYNQYGQVLLFWLAAISGIFFIINLAKSLAVFPKVANVFKRIGQNSLYILCAHNIIFMLLNGLFHRFYNFTHVNMSLIDLPLESITITKIFMVVLYVLIGLVFSQQVKRLMFWDVKKFNWRNVYAKLQFNQIVDTNSIK